MKGPSRPLSGALLAGALAGVGRPGVDAPILTFLGLVCLFWLTLRASSLRVALTLGALYGIAESTIAFWGTISWGYQVPLALTVLGVSIHHLPLAVWGYACGRREASWVGWLGAGALAAALEGFADALGFSNKLAAVLVAGWPAVLGLARWIGGDLVSGIIAATCFAVARTLVSKTSPHSLRWKRGALAAGLGLGGLLLGSAMASWSAMPAQGSLSVGIVQQNVPSEYPKSRMASRAVRKAFQSDYHSLVARLATSELLVHTEAFDAAFPLILPARRAEFAEMARRNRQHVLATSYLPEKSGKKSNTAGLFGPSGQFLGLHRKVQLAPFGEDALHAGTTFRPLSMADGTPIGVLICMESILPEGPLALVRQGARLLVVATSDVTFGSSVTAFEHLALTRIRAIETGRDVVWASNAGPSGVIDRLGELSVGPFQRPVAVRAVARLYSDETTYVRYRWLWALLPIVVFVACAVQLGKSLAEAAAPLPAPVRNWATLLTGAAALVVSTGAALGTPALVHLRQAGSGRATTAIWGHFRHVPTLVDRNPYRPYQGNGEAGALASYLLTYYGADIAAAELSAPLPPSAEIASVSRYLESQHGLTLRAFPSERGLPLLAALVGTQRGETGISESSARPEDATLFLPRRWTHVPASAVQLRSPAYLPLASDTDGSK